MILALVLAGCGGECEVDGPLAYDADANWLCRPGFDGACPRERTVVAVDEGGGFTERTIEALEDPPFACFGVYPTLDLRLRVDLHHDLDDLDDPRAWARDQLAPLAGICDLWVPVYRQVSIGTYFGKRTENKDTCHQSAFTDVLAAFEAFLVAEPTRPFALIGHSQGGHRISQLLHERIEGDPALRARLIAAYPIGWPVGTDEGSDVGGSFDDLPVCTARGQTGCVVGYRSVIEGDELADGGPYQEGDELVCVNPGSPDDPGARALLASFTMAATSEVLDHRPDGVADDVLLEWPNAFEATCLPDGSRGLEVRWVRSDDPPVDLDGLDVSVLNGAHILDMNLGISDLTRDLAERAAAMLP